MNSEIGSLKERIRLCAENVGGGNELSRKTGIPRNTLESYLIGNSEPQVSRLVKIAKAAGVSIEWLAVGEMNENSSAQQIEKIDQQLLEKTIRLLEEELESKKYSLSPSQKAKSIIEFYNLYSSMAAMASSITEQDANLVYPSTIKKINEAK